MADTLRLATWHGDFSRKGPGLLVKALAGEDPVPGLDLLAETGADVLLLTQIDYDAGHVALGLLQSRLFALGLEYSHVYAARPNTGRATGRDLDGDGRRGGPRDAQGFGWFAGQGGMAVLSRHPLRAMQDLSGLLWRDLPDSAMRADDLGHDIQRLSSAAHWHLRVETPDGSLDLLTLAATPPVFDGPEDRNGRRNRDEVLLWAHVIDGRLGTPPDAPFAVIGNLNLDPARGDGIRSAPQRLLVHPRLQDPLPGQPTVTWDSTGPMRVSYVLPDRQLRVAGAGVTSPAEGAGPHGLVWVDLVLPEQPSQLPEPEPPPPG
ncbi:endonuclease [Pseudoponticoccus marisrubri]|uniref:Endonuclease n=1 Tax=Pseudoponticoccus marisrubri TaxID=1685382 RepID=A0A0W7WJP4_9RHOB|nr:endonuclease [Pseudoponticoccus marisrubri]